MNKLDGLILNEEDDGTDVITKKKKEEKKKITIKYFWKILVYNSNCNVFDDV